MFDLKRKLLTIAVGATLSACGGGSSSTATTSAGSGLLPGILADGYLVGATVCLDMNKNKACEATEPQAVTGLHGAFSIEVPAGVDASAYPIVAMVTDTTVDEDTEEAVAEAFVLTAPAALSAGQRFVSPLSTMVQAKLEANPALSVSDAEALVKADLGITHSLSLFDNYVAGKQDTTNSADDRNEFKRLHSLAKVVARQLGQELKTGKASIGSLSEGDEEALIDLALGAIIAELDQIKAFVDNNTDADTGEIGREALLVVEGKADHSGQVTGSLSMGATYSREAVDNRKTKAGVLASARMAASEQLKTLMAEGAYFFGIQGGYLSCDEIIVSTTGAVSNAEYEFDEGDFVKTDETETRDLLTAEGWQTVDSSDEQVAFKKDGSLIRSVAGVTYDRFRAVWFDLSGAAFQNHLQAELASLVGETSFSGGAEAARFTRTALADQYRVEHWDCGASAMPEAMNPCNYLRVIDDSGYTGDYAADLETLKTGYVQIGSYLTARLEAGGVLGIYKELWAEGVFSRTALTQGTWVEKTVNGENLVLVSLPDTVDTWYQISEGRQVVLAVIDGYVRIGEYMAKGTIVQAENLGFNGVARGDLVTAFKAASFSVSTVVTGSAGVSAVPGS
ncbi:MAG: hypothetical protein ACPGF7_07120 [Pontibacterium sp.]